MVTPVAMAECLRASLIRDGPGVVEAPALAATKVVIHVGKPVRMLCTHGDEREAGLAIHGDIDIIPEGMPSRWEMTEPDTALVLCLPAAYLQAMAADAGPDAAGVRIQSRFRARDRQLEHIGWALLAEADAGSPSGALYVESLAAALAARLLQGYAGARAGLARLAANQAVAGRQMRRVVAYVEENLAQPLTLRQTAAVAGLSASHFKAQFRRAAGMPFHQYVIRRRVERAAELLRSGKTSISAAALEAGFCHASHLAAQMRRVLGVRPQELARGGE